MAMAREVMPPDEQNLLVALSARGDKLSPDEQLNLQTLRRHYGEITLRKARAYALLSARGGKPLLEESRAT